MKPESSRAGTEFETRDPAGRPGRMAIDGQPALGMMEISLHTARGGSLAEEAFSTTLLQGCLTTLASIPSAWAQRSLPTHPHRADSVQWRGRYAAEQGAWWTGRS